MHDEPTSGRWWVVGVFGLLYGGCGALAFFASRHVRNPWRTVLAGVGILLGAAGAWCLLWFLGIVTIAVVLRGEHWRRNWMLLVWFVLVLAVIVDWRLFGLP